MLYQCVGAPLAGAGLDDAGFTSLILLGRRGNPPPGAPHEGPLWVYLPPGSTNGCGSAAYARPGCYRDSRDIPRATIRHCGGNRFAVYRRPQPSLEDGDAVCSPPG